jgi:predicted nuclease with TOPRIM domain
MQTEVQNKDFELENLKAALTELKISLDEKLSNADSYEKRLIEREKEVLRLQVKLEENPVDFLKLNENYEQKVSNDLVSSLEGRLDHLRTENQKLQTSLSSSQRNSASKDPTPPPPPPTPGQNPG